MIQDWQAAVEDLKDNVRHEIITLTNLARELTSIAYPIAEILEQHIKKVGALHTQTPAFSSAMYRVGRSRAAQSPSAVYMIPRILSGHLLTSEPGTSPEETAGNLSAGLHCQERRHTLHPLLWQKSLCDVHGGLCLGRPAHPSQARGDATDLERARARLHRHHSGLPSWSCPTDRECPHQGQNLCPAGPTAAGAQSDAQ